MISFNQSFKEQKKYKVGLNLKCYYFFSLDEDIRTRKKI